MAKKDVFSSSQENIYDTKTNHPTLQKEYGFTEEIVKKISKDKEEPDWVLEIRLKALKKFYELEDPSWGPDLSFFDLSQIATYVKPVSGEVRK